MLEERLKGYRFPLEIIDYCVWSYHRFNDSYRDIQERLAFRGLDISHETIRTWCLRLAAHYVTVIRKQAHKPTDKWPLDERVIKINGERYVLWRAVDSTGHELDILGVCRT